MTLSYSNLHFLRTKSKKVTRNSKRWREKNNVLGFVLDAAASVVEDEADGAAADVLEAAGKAELGAALVELGARVRAFLHRRVVDLHRQDLLGVVDQRHLRMRLLGCELGREKCQGVSEWQDKTNRQCERANSWYRLKGRWVRLPIPFLASNWIRFVDPLLVLVSCCKGEVIFLLNAVV